MGIGGQLIKANNEKVGGVNRQFQLPLEFFHGSYECLFLDVVSFLCSYDSTEDQIVIRLCLKQLELSDLCFG